MRVFRVPQSPDDPACALPNLSEYIAALRDLDKKKEICMETLVSTDSTT